VIPSYISRDSIIHRLDPRTKLIWLFVMYTVVLFFDHPTVLLSLFMLVVALWFAARLQANTLWGLLRPFFGMALLIILIWIVFFPGKTVLYEVPYIHLKITLESSIHAVGVALRFLILLSTTYLVLLTTRICDITLGLRKFGLPYMVGFLFAASIGFLPVILSKLNEIMESQKSRGVELEKGNVITRAKNLMAVLVPLVFTSIQKAKVLGYALEVRAFGASKHRTFMRDTRMKTLDYIALALIVGLFIVSIYLRKLGYGIVRV